MNGTSGTDPVSNHDVVSNGVTHLYDDGYIQDQMRQIIDDEEKESGGIDFPFYLGDLRKLREEYSAWTTHFPRVEVFYAVKCCTELPFLQQLVDLNSSFDCASKREMETIIGLGVDPSRIIFANTIKSVSAIKYASEHGISLMTFDNEFELRKIKAHFPKARLVLRLRCEKTSHTGYAFGMKFGCSMNKVEKMLNTAKSEDLNVVGVSFHVGCNTDNEEPYVKAILDAHKVFQLGKKSGFSFTLLDIGGGFAGYHPPGTSFAKTAERVNKVLDEYFPSERGVRIIAEPGTRLATSTYTWAVKVIGKSSNESMEEGQVMHECKLISVTPRFLYYVNDGFFGSLTLNVAELPNIKVLRHKGTESNNTYPSVVFGPTCDPCDVLYPSINLPELEIGDWLYLENAGAYSLAKAGDFNMMDKPRCFYLEDH